MSGLKMRKFPFEVSVVDIEGNMDGYVEAVFSCLESEFLTMPKGEGFVEYPVFEKGYEAIKGATKEFSHFDADSVLDAVKSEPIAIVVLRTMLGFTPPEWGYVTSQKTDVEVTQGYVRSLDRKVRMAPETSINTESSTYKRVQAMIETACILLDHGAPEVGERQFHRLDKADTRNGLESMNNVARLGVPYAMLLYERFLGRPFAGHRDSVSELIGGSLESAIEEKLTESGISYRKTKRAERIEGFDQVPDFIVPSEYNPQVIIEAKITEDDGTARDKVTRIQHLGELSLSGRSAKNPKYEVIACIGGRGFGVRKEDMRKMIRATKGKVFTLKTLNRLVECTRLSEFKTK